MSDPAPLGPRRRAPLLRMLVGEVLRRRRLDQRRTLVDVATAARVSVQYLSAVERGRKEVSSEVLAAICEALRMDLSDLLAEVRAELVILRDVTAGPVPVIRLDTARQRYPRSPSVRRPGDAVLLAA